MNPYTMRVFGSIFLIVGFIAFATVSGYGGMLSSMSTAPRLSEIKKMSTIENNSFWNISFIPNFGNHNRFVSPWGAGSSDDYDTIVTDYGLVIATFMKHKGNMYSLYRDSMRYNY